MAGLAAFASLATNFGPAIGTVAVGVLSIGAAMLVFLQTFIRPENRSAEHRATAARYAAVRRRLEQLTTLHLTRDELDRAINETRLTLDFLAEVAPEVPKLKNIKSRAEKRLKEKGN